MFHHMVIHFPIALWILGACLALLEVWSTKFEEKGASSLWVWLGTVFLCISIATGLWIEDEYGHALLERHKTMAFCALGTACLTCLLQWFQRRHVLLYYARIVFFCATAACVGWVGHLGGRMSHEVDAPTIPLQPPSRSKNKLSTQRKKPKEDVPLLLPPPKIPSKRKSSP